MARRAKDQKHSASPKRGEPSRPAPTSEVQAISRGRRWAYRMAALVLIPALIFIVLELGLRIGGYGYSTSFFRKLSIEGQPWLVENDNFGLRFFPPAMARLPAPITMRAQKEPGSIRIFIFGESAALGDPRPNYGASRYFEMLLRERFPGNKFEVVNTSVTAINSHVIWPIAKECASHEGDLWIIYMGNNEMVGPFGAATVFGNQAPPIGIVRFNLALQKTKIGQLLVSVGRKLRPGARSQGWKGMEMFQQNKVPPQDPRRATVHDSFRRNLEDIVRAGTHSGAKILLSTVAVNLKDCPPFASLSATNLPPGPGADYDRFLSQAAVAEERSDFKAAQGFYAGAEKILPESADLQFRYGTCLLRLTNAIEARTHFLKAVDTDTLPFRTDSRINGTATEVAHKQASGAVAFCDAEKALSVDSPAGPGKESFYEHVHLTCEGNFRLGLAWAMAAETLLPAEVRQRATSDWISATRCDRLLGLTDWNRVSIYEEVLNRCKQPPLRDQSGNADRLRALEAAIAELRAKIASTPIEEARRVYLEAIKAAPEDFRVRENYAEFLDAVHDGPAVLEQRREICRRIPHYYFPHYALGLTLKEQGNLPEALECFERAAAINPIQGEVRLEIGRVHGAQGKMEKALQDFELASQFLPQDPRPRIYRGQVLWKADRREEALESFRRATQLAPEYWEAHYRLGEHLAMANQLESAAAEFKETIRLNPQYVKAHANLGVALAKLGRNAEAVRAFDKALELDPNNKQLLEFRQRAQGR